MKLKLKPQQVQVKQTRYQILRLISMEDCPYLRGISTSNNMGPLNRFAQIFLISFSNNVIVSPWDHVGTRGHTKVDKKKDKYLNQSEPVVFIKINKRKCEPRRNSEASLLKT